VSDSAQPAPLIYQLVYDIETISGLQRYLEELLLHLGPAGFRFVGLTNNAGVQAAFESLGHPCLCRAMNRYWAWNYPGLLRQLEREHGSPALIHLHGFVSGIWGPRGARRVFGPRPLLHTPNSMQFKKQFLQPLFVRLWLRSLRRCGGQLIAVAPSERDEMQRLGAGGDIPIHLVPNGIRLDSLPAAELRGDARARLGLPADAVVVGNIGRLHYQKDPLTFVRAALRVAEQRPEVYFVMVGGGVLEPEVRELAAPLGDRMLLAGWREDGVLLCRAFDIAVNCSRYEGQSIALLELLGMGLAVVATRCVGNRDLVSEQTGVPVAVGDPAALASALLLLLDDPQRAAALGRAARLHVETHHSARLMAEQTGELYSRLLQRL